MLTLLLDLILLIGLLVGATAWGNMILQRIHLELMLPWERILIATGLGLAILVYVTVALASMGMLYAFPIYVLYVLGLAASLMHLRRVKVSFNRTLTRLEMLLLMLLAIIAILVLVAVLSPPADWDSLMYHLEVPNRYVQAGGYVYLPNAYANFPQFVETLYAFALLLHDDILARLVNLALGGLATLTVYVIARRFIERGMALLAVFIFVSSPLVTFVFVEVFIEAGLTFYSLLTILAILHWRSSGNQRWLYLAAVLMGVSCGIKYYTVILVPIFLWALWERAWWMERRAWLQILYLTIVAGLVSLLFPLPWLIKNLILIGDPVFPVLSGLLGRWGDGIAQANWDFYGMGYTPLDYLLLPWRMIFGDRFGVPQPGFLFLLLLPLLFLLPRALGTLRWLSGVILLWFVFWANSAGQSVRFFLPGLALLSVVFGGMLTCMPRWLVRIRPVLVAVIVLVALYQLVWPIFYASWALSYLTGQQSRDEYLMHRLDIYPVADYANQNLSPAAQIATVWEERGYYFDRPLIIGQSPDGAFIHQFVVGDDPTQLAKAFLSRGITHLIINNQLAHDLEFNLRDRYIYGVTTSSLLVYTPAFRACFLDPLFEHRGITLYQVLLQPTCTR